MSVQIQTTTDVIQVVEQGDGSVVLQVQEASAIYIKEADVSVPDFGYYQKKIYVSTDEPLNPEENDLWLDIS